MPIIDQSGVYDLSNMVYHSHPTPTPSLSSGIARVLLDRSPAHAWQQHPKNPAFVDENKQQWDLGSAAHDMLLEGDARIVMIKADDYRTADAKAARDRAYARGFIPLLTHQRPEVESFVLAIKVQLAAHEDTAYAFVAGKPEQSIFWTENVEGAEIWCQIRPDWIDADPKRPFLDFKSTATSVHPDVIGRWSTDQGHPFMAAFYRRGIKRVLGIDAHYKFVVAENKPPHALVVIDYPPMIEQEADMQVEIAIRKWARCVAAGEFPAYPLRTYTIDPPKWASSRWLESFERAKIEGYEKFDPELAKLVGEGWAPL